ncbi:hypothetical protein BASA50_002327 [Batrachochytrium salamandrivorans]|uniref:N-acetyltransferase domain-containing protein n=1 Tax=Batrachochytrium salamandrivorans TaxID=1357716 RepID=A0ABQ8FPN2_9FUNG|nr:hypothetical protein BASA50_002327 [Batrachochytrium salamandrivorans]KAH9276704.1 hypothetical protein BASA83_000837 [Batrachochytrium salamandrivorans]
MGLWSIAQSLAYRYLPEEPSLPTPTLSVASSDTATIASPTLLSSSRQPRPETNVEDDCPRGSSSSEMRLGYPGEHWIYWPMEVVKSLIPSGMRHADSCAASAASVNGSSSTLEQDSLGQTDSAAQTLLAAEATNTNGRTDAQMMDHTYSISPASNNTQPLSIWRSHQQSEGSSASTLHSHHHSIHQQSHPHPSYYTLHESAWPSPIAFSYQLACGWFISIAIAFTFISVPISAISLPFVLLFGLSTAIAVVVISLVVRIWVRLLLNTLQAVQSLAFLPRSLFSLASGTFSRVRSMMMGSQHPIRANGLPPAAFSSSASQTSKFPTTHRKHHVHQRLDIPSLPESTHRVLHRQSPSSFRPDYTSQYTPDDPRYFQSFGDTVNTPLGSRNSPSAKMHSSAPYPWATSSSAMGSQSELSRSAEYTSEYNTPLLDPREGQMDSSDDIVNADILRQLGGDDLQLLGGSDGVELNPQPLSRQQPPLGKITIRLLSHQDTDRIALCCLLYAVTTNVPMEDVLLTVGDTPDGNTHNILSIWNEDIPDLPSNSELTLKNLVGFADYFSQSHASPISGISIDRLIISNTYTNMGFSKRLLRKLQHTPDIHTIHVWSLWHTVQFYKGLGFINVYEECISEEPIVLTQPRKLHRKRSKLRRIEGEWGPLLCWQKDNDASNERGLRPRDSMVSLAGGIGAGTGMTSNSTPLESYRQTY